MPEPHPSSSKDNYDLKPNPRQRDWGMILLKAVIVLALILFAKSYF